MNEWGNKFYADLKANSRVPGVGLDSIHRLLIDCWEVQTEVFPGAADVFRAASAGMILRLMLRAGGLVRVASKACSDSPIEKVFAMALVSVAFDYVSLIQINDKEIGTTIQSPFECGSNSHIGSLSIEPQKQLGQYRVDFLLTTIPKNGQPRQIVVELDGHEFHERTKEQISKDKKRDRELQKLGHQVFRYSGSDIWKSPVGCAIDVMEHLSVALNVEATA
jgi:very-short-patch-repair endonuclease